MGAGKVTTAETRAGVTCWDGASEETLRIALSPPASRCVEADLIGQCDGVVSVTQDEGHLSLILSTRSACRHAIVKTFVGAMECRTPLSPDLRDRIYSAVQEALMNAVFHGNLRIDPHLRNTLEGLSVVHQTIETRLTLPEVGLAMIRMEAAWNSSALHVVIGDGGEGYDAAELSKRKASSSPENASARGLDILKAFCDGVEVSNGGTTVKLEFRR
jgi:Histidine kinase-like ATPase domain